MTQRSRWPALCGALLLAALACAEEAITPESVEGPITWADLSVQKIRHLYLGGQPDHAALEAARAAGVSVVINLRKPTEHNWDEAAVAAELGMRYFRLPVDPYQPFRSEVMQQIEEVVQANHGQKIFVHCSSGNRAAGWLAAHLIEEHELDAETAVAVGRRAGITKDSVVEQVWHYVH